MNDQAECTSCIGNFSLITQNNLKFCVRLINNCISYDLRINCITCAPGFTLQYNRCKSIRCSQFDTLCRGCFNPFVLNTTSGLCTDTNCLNSTFELCLICKSGFYLLDSPTDTLCTPIPSPNCDQATRNTGKCTQCQAGFVPNVNGTCVSASNIYNGCASQAYPCPKCSVGYFLGNGLCYARRCANITAIRDCSSCINYYTFDPTSKFCILHNCNDSSCYESDDAGAGF